MSDHPRPSRLARLLARGYPAALRERFAEDIARFIDDSRRDPANRNQPLRRLRIGMSLVWDALLAFFRSSPPPPRRAAGPDLTQRLRNFRMDLLWQDLRLGLRGLIRRPAFTLVALVSLMLGIGANTAIFTLVRGVLLRELPYPDPDRLVTVWTAGPGQSRDMLSVPDLADLARLNRTFAEIGTVRSLSVNLTGGDVPERLIGSFVTAPSLRLLGATATVGRLFGDDDTALGAGQRVAVLSYHTWQRRYGGDPGIVGRTMVLNGLPHQVIGVTGPGYRDPFDADVWLPITSAPNRAWFERTNATVWGVGRMKPGITRAEATRDLDAIMARLAPERSAVGRVGLAVLDMREELVGRSRFTLIVLFGAVAAVLLIVCANIANLQLVRASTRTREMSVRAAVGASRGRLAQQVIVESLLLALVGATLGVAAGTAAVKILVGMIRLPSTHSVGLDWSVLGFSALLAVVTGVAFGAPAALAGARADLQDALRARADAPTAARTAGRHALVVAELALCIALLSVAGLFTRSLLALQRVDPGFDGRHVLTAEFRLPSVKYDDSAKVAAFVGVALERLRSIPGVTAAALVGAVPLSGNVAAVGYVAQGQPQPAPGAAPMAQYTAATDGYFRAMGIPLLAGRDFTVADGASGELVTIVSSVFAERAWPGLPAVGKTIELIGPPNTVARVIGVVGPIKQFTLSESATPQLYLNKYQTGGIFSTIVLRTAGDPDATSPALHQAVWSVDRDQPIWKVRSMRFLLERDLSPASTSVTLIGAFAILALVLGVIGVYGVMSFTVAQRTREMVIRMALGASGGQVSTLILRSGMVVVAIAIVLGVAGALVAGRLLAAKLYGVSATDPTTMAGVPLLLGAVALLACWIPARRAARSDPAVALRED